MKIILKKLNLENFKGIKNKTIDFNKDMTNILGENATGKTTIYDAYSWLLWNKDSQNKADFNIKTIGIEGEAIHNLEHSVTGEFLILNEDENINLKLKKVLAEKWTKQRGATTKVFTGHTTDYFINDVPVKLKEFNSRIEKLITEDQFKLLSNPIHFNSNMKMQEKRDLILSLINTVDYKDIIAKNKDLEPLIELLDKYTIEELLAMAKSKKAVINDRLKDLPIKINERFDSKKEDIDFDTLEINRRVVVGTIDKIDEDLANQDNTSVLKEKQQKIRDLTIEQENIITDVEKQNRENTRKHQEAIEDKNNNIKNYNNIIKDLQLKKAETLELVKTYNSNVGDFRKEYVGIANNLSEIEVDITCPTCNQNLPTEDIEEQRNLVKSNSLNNISNKANEILKKIELLEKDILSFNEKIDNYKYKLEQEEIKTIEEPILVVTPQKYHDITEQITELKEEIKEFNVTDNTELIETKKELQEELQGINSQLAFKEVNKIADEKIKEYEEEQKLLNKEFDEISKIIYLCEEFTKVKVDYISDDINSMFKLVKFKLFENQINGGINEICEATVDDVPFSDLNNAMKINAGIDIINTLSEHYGIATPIFIDNAESINILEETDSQVIRLVVSNDKELVIK